MSPGSTHSRGRSQAAVLWLLLALLVAVGVLGYLELLGGSERGEEGVAPSPTEETRTAPDPLSTAPTPVPLSEPAVEGSQPVDPQPDGARLPVEGGRSYPVAGIVSDARTGEPVPLYEVYLAAGGGDPLELPETQRPHHVRNLEGRFGLSVPTEGTHRLLIRSGTHEDLTLHVTVPLAAPLSLFLHRGTWIRGRVGDELGNPRPHVTLWLLPEGGFDEGARPEVARTATDAEGAFAFYKVTPGTYRLAAGTVTAPLDLREELSVEAGQEVEEYLVVPRLTTLLLLVFEADGKPLADARVTVLTQEGDVIRTAFTDSKGAARLPSLREGPHRLQIRATGLALLEEEIHISVVLPEMELRRTLVR